MAARVTDWLVAGDLRRLAAFGAGLGSLTVGAGLGFRQWHLKQSPILPAAAEQVRQAQAVERLLGGPVVSTEGAVGGYMDPVKGTAVLTLPVETASGARGVARVEAEAEWVLEQARAAARGEEPPAVDRSENTRWMLRHLDVEAPAAADGSRRRETLYSLPQHVPLSPWAPSRGHDSALPDWLRALLPNPAAVQQDDAMPRLIGVGLAVLGMHAAAFVYLKRRLVAEKAMTRAESLLALAETPALHAMRERAFTLAGEALARSGGNRIAFAKEAVLFGTSSKEQVSAYVALAEKRELFFRAESVGAKEWQLTHVAVERTDAWARRVAALPDGATAEDYAEAMASVPTVPLDLGTIDRRVHVAQKGSSRRR